MMMNKLYLLFLFFFLKTALLLSQNVDFQRDIMPIIQKNCTPCHHKGGAAPFTLSSYKDLSKRKDFIKIVTETRYMPPWYADVSFQSYHNERFLSESDIKKIAAWADSNVSETQYSDLQWSSIETTTRVNHSSSIEIPLNQPFTIPSTNQEQFRVFVLPTNTKEPIFIKGIDFIPGYKPLAHHNRIMIDTTRKLRADDGIEVGASSEFSKQHIKLADEFWYGWVPGKQAIFYPKGMARRLPANADLVINMHYAPSSREIKDNSRVILYPVNQQDTITRLVQTYVMDESTVVNEPFEIAADTVIKFYMKSPIIPYDISLLSVLPHLHKLGKNFKAYAITSNGDLIPLIKINDWNFNWQMNYQFKNLLKIPSGSIIFAEAEFDNTSKNPKNPFFPPQKIQYGWGTNNEMFNLIMEFVVYKKGDEIIKY
jgi:hypothetical protein